METRVRNRERHFPGKQKWIAVLAVLLLAATSIAVAQKSLDDIPDRLLTNQDVIEMLGSGVTPIGVIKRIHNSPCKFDKSAAGLEALHAANVPYNVVLAMMKAPELPPATKGRISLVIPDSTPIKLGLSEDLDSNVQRPGYIIYFHVLEDIRIRGLRVIAKGARVRGRLLDSKDRSRTGQVARLEWSLLDVETVDAQRLPLRGGGEISGGEFSSEKTVTVGKGEEYEAFTYGVRKVNILAPILPAPKNQEVPQNPNPGQAREEDLAFFSRPVPSQYAVS
jgi:hypothetical protein